MVIFKESKAYAEIETIITYLYTLLNAVGSEDFINYIHSFYILRLRINLDLAIPAINYNASDLDMKEAQALMNSLDQKDFERASRYKRSFTPEL